MIRDMLLVTVPETTWEKSSSQWVYSLKLRRCISCRESSKTRRVTIIKTMYLVPGRTKRGQPKNKESGRPKEY